MDLTLRSWATRTAARIDSSLLATDAERSEALAIAGQLVADPRARQQNLDTLMRLEQLAEEVSARESGRAYLSVGEREELQESLVVLEERLVSEINARKLAQRRDLIFFLVLLCLLILATGAGAAYLLIARVSGTEVIGQVIALAVGVVSVLIVARLFQNAREALERLDEKVVAVRFLRMALHPSWTGDLGERLIAPALTMFAQHFAPSSATLGAEDSQHLLDPFSFVRRQASRPGGIAGTGGGAVRGATTGTGADQVPAAGIAGTRRRPGAGA